MAVEIKDLSEEYADFLHDESRRAGHAEKIAFPKSTAEVCEVLKLHDRITIQGGRTGITGGCVPDGGLILNLSRMNAIGEIEGDRMRVRPGALLADIREGIKNSGLFFPSDPTETTASIGGMVATNASGARSFRYGSVRNWIQALEVVLANGETVRVERGVHRADGLVFKLGSIEGTLPTLRMPKVKNAAGYFVRSGMDLIDLFIGAEGTLGVVTEITIQLLPEPERITGLIAFFPAEAEALGFVRFLRGIPPTAIEFFDGQSLDLLRRTPSDLPELKPEFHTAIYFEYEGEIPEAAVEKAEEAIDCWVAEGDREIETLKQFRHAVPEVVNQLIAERKMTKLGTDMSVPDDQLENVMRMYHAGLDEAGLEYAIFGHIGNNHVHVNILLRSRAEYEKGKALYLDWTRQVVAMGGSVSAEHGIGKIKTEFLKLMYGDEGIREMQRLKQLFDPQGLLNPGNLFD
jgi:D-lactate dehydrogenase (cytochrome)